MTEQAQGWACFAEYLTHSLRKGISGMQADSLKRKDDSSRFPPSCVAVSLRYRANFRQKITPFWNINQIPFRTDVTSCTSTTSHR